MKRAYPTILTKTKDLILVEVPDLEIVTEGKDLGDAIEMARDAIGISGISILDRGDDIPEPSERTINILNFKTCYIPRRNRCLCITFSPDDPGTSYTHAGR